MAEVNRADTDSNQAKINQFVDDSDATLDSGDDISESEDEYERIRRYKSRTTPNTSDKDTIDSQDEGESKKKKTAKKTDVTRGSLQPEDMKNDRDAGYDVGHDDDDVDGNEDDYDKDKDKPQELSAKAKKYRFIITALLLLLNYQIVSLKTR